MEKGTKIDSGYATTDSDGVNYRDIAELMTEIGHDMNHSSVRNYVIRSMQKFALALNNKLRLDLTVAKINELAKSPLFQSGVADLLRAYEDNRKQRKQ